MRALTLALWVCSVLRPIACFAHAAQADAQSAYPPELVIPLIVAAALYGAGYARMRSTSAPGRQRRSTSAHQCQHRHSAPTPGPQRTRSASAHGRRIYLFAIGLLTLILCLMSPLDRLSAEFFSIHMVQHELLMLVAAPLLVLAQPLPVFLWAFPPAARASISGVIRGSAWKYTWAVLTGPLSGWMLHAAALWAWHAPSLFQAALRNPSTHEVQHLSFFLSALIFWNGLFRVRSAARSGAAILYLFTTTVHTSVLGALITFASRPWFSDSLRSTDGSLTAMEDQQLGGLIMWIPGSLVYVGAGLWMLVRWIQSAAPTDDFPARGAGDTEVTPAANTDAVIGAKAYGSGASR